MKILILGGDGMLGHQLFLHLKKNHEVSVTLRNEYYAYQHYQLFNKKNCFFGVDIRIKAILTKILYQFKPDVVINGIGIIKQRSLAKEIIPSLEINALFPHQLSQLSQELNAKVIHFSTDCIFSGKKGNYVESDISDAEDLYGRTKYLGEITGKHCLTLRSSIIGLELARKTGLIEWFLSQTGKINGYKKAIFSGLTTLEMSRVIDMVITKFPSLSGIWHVSSKQAINKFELLSKFSNLLNRSDVIIHSNDDFVCDRSLSAEAFFHLTGYQSPSWDDMLCELSNEVKNRNYFKSVVERKCSL